MHPPALAVGCTHVILQAYATRDVTETNYGGFDTRVWGRIIIPFLDPIPAATAPVVIRR